MKELQHVARRLEALAGIARGNARAAKIKDDDDTWRAHAEALDRAAASIRKHLSQEQKADT